MAKEERGIESFIMEQRKKKRTKEHPMHLNELMILHSTVP